MRATSDTSVDRFATSSDERDRPSPIPNHDPSHGHDRAPSRAPSLDLDRLRLVCWS